MAEKDYSFDDSTLRGYEERVGGSMDLAFFVSQVASDYAHIEANKRGSFVNYLGMRLSERFPPASATQELPLRIEGELPLDRREGYISGLGNIVPA